MSGIATIFALLMILIIPSLVWFALGPFDARNSGDDKFMTHAMIFMVLSFALFIPTAYAVFGADEAIQETGVNTPELATGGDMANEESTLTGAGVLAWVGGGIMVYWVSYIAGTNMRKAYNTSGPIT